MRPITVLTFALVIMAGCGRDTQLRIGVDDGMDHDPSLVTCDEFANEGLAVRATTREEFRAALGEPLGVDAEAEPNRHNPGLTDTIIRMRYDGLVAQLRRPGGGGDLLERVEVRDNGHLRHDELGIGAPIERVIDAFGAPHRQQGARLIYQCGAGEVQPEEPVIFVAEDGRVGEVHFTRYVD